MSEQQQHHFKAEVTQVLKLVIQSLYSKPEVFLRELVSNASDALDKARFSAIQRPELLGENEELKVRLLLDPEHKKLTVWDNGIGMTAEELAQSLGTVAWSGTRKFAEELERAKGSEQKLELIGQFGVGFYSAYLVADEVEVLSRARGEESAHVWRSKGQETFTIEPASREVPGTSVTLHLKEGSEEFLEEFRLRSLVTRYSDYISHPIELVSPQEGGEPKAEVINRASALWQRNPKELTEEQYTEFYKHLSHDWEAPLAHRHFKIEGTQLFVGLLFLPKRAPFDLFEAEPRHGVRLHVKRVFVMDDCKELVPRWLRFVRGVVDSEDLPLNVSREILQDSRAVRIIRKQVVQQSLEMLEELAEKQPAEYQVFFKACGAVLKEGLHFEPEYRERLSGLLRYESSKVEGLTSLQAYLERMQEGQPAIYYATGASRQQLESSPHLEALRARGYEVLYMEDPVDPFAVAALEKYKDKPLVSAMDAKLELEEEQAKGEKAEPPPQAHALLARMQEVLSGRVQEVKASHRLKESPVCLVVPEGGMAPHVERMLRAQRLNLPGTLRILEVNLEHPLIQRLAELEAAEPKSERLAEWVELLHAQALLSEGSPLEDPAGFAKKLEGLLRQAVEVKPAAAEQSAPAAPAPPS